MPLDNPYLSAANPYRPNDQEVDGLLSSLMAPVKWAGETLSKPAAALRGLLAGQPGQLANLIPFSDTLGITDPRKRVSGRDMLRSWGAIGPDNNSGNFLGGMLAEVLTDPLVLAAPFGGIAKGTQMLSKAAGLGGEAATIGDVAGAAGSKIGDLAAKVGSKIPQGIKDIPGRVGGVADDLLGKVGAPRMFMGSSPAQVFPAASEAAGVGPFGSSLGKGAEEAAAQLKLMRDSLAGASPSEASELWSGINMLSSPARGPFGADPSRIAGLMTNGTSPLLPRAMGAAQNFYQNAPSWSGIPYMKYAGRQFMNQPAGALLPELSVGASLDNMADQPQPGPDPMQMAMLMQQLGRRRRLNPMMQAAGY